MMLRRKGISAARVGDDGEVVYTFTVSRIGTWVSVVAGLLVIAGTVYSATAKAGADQVRAILRTESRAGGIVDDAICNTIAKHVLETVETSAIVERRAADRLTKIELRIATIEVWLATLYERETGHPPPRPDVGGNP